MESEQWTVIILKQKHGMCFLDSILCQLGRISVVIETLVHRKHELSKQ